MAAPTFWGNQQAAQETIGRLKSLNAIVNPLEQATRAAKDLPGLLELGDQDEAFAAEARSEVERLEKAFEDLELKSLLSGEHDSAGAMVSIYARDGGTDANDWAEMLLRMYTQWAQKNGYSVELIDREIGRASCRERV